MAEQEKEEKRQYFAEEILQNAKSVFQGGSGIFPKEEIIAPGNDGDAGKAKPENKEPEKKDPVVPDPEKKEPEKKEPEKVPPAKETIETPLFNINVSAEKGKLPTADEALSLFNKKTGLNLTKPEDIFEKADIIAEAITGQDTMSEDVRLAMDYKAFFETQLPPDLKALNIAFLEKKDYREMMKSYSSPGIDLSRKFSEYPDAYPIIARYSPDITKEDFDDMDEAPKKAVVNAAKQAYNIEFESHVQLAKDFESKQKQRVDGLFKSVDVTMQNVKTKFPDLDKKRLRDIEKKLVNFEFSRDLMTPEGNYKPEAGVKVAFATFGEETMDIMIGNLQKKHIAEKDAEINKRTAEELELISRGRNDNPPSSGGDGSKKGTPSESVLVRNDDMFGGGKNNLVNREKK